MHGIIIRVSVAKNKAGSSNANLPQAQLDFVSSRKLAQCCEDFIRYVEKFSGIVMHFS